MKQFYFIFTFMILSSFSINGQKSDLLNQNLKIIQIVEKYGPSISPTYEQAVCTELVIGVLEHMYELDSIDKRHIRIIVDENVYDLIDNGSSLPKGVYHALTFNNRGVGIDSLSEVLAGDFVQFWYPNSWGHCGIVHSIDIVNNKMKLYSSFPSTNGYGIQEYDIPNYCFFVRLK